MRFFLRWALISLVMTYRVLIGPFVYFITWNFGYASGCRYHVTCSQFALNELKNTNHLGCALKAIFLRLLSCHPFSKKAPI